MTWNGTCASLLAPRLNNDTNAWDFSQLHCTTRGTYRLGCSYYCNTPSSTSWKILIRCCHKLDQNRSRHSSVDLSRKSFSWGLVFLPPAIVFPFSKPSIHKFGKQLCVCGTKFLVNAKISDFVTKQNDLLSVFTSTGVFLGNSNYWVQPHSHWVIEKSWIYCEKDDISSGAQ